MDTGISGYGQLMSPHGDLLYVGHLSNSIPNGFGIQFITIDSKTFPIYIGSWSNGIRNGLGIEIIQSKTILKKNKEILYRWNDGMIVTNEIIDPQYKKMLLDTKKDIMKERRFLPVDITNLDEIVDVIMEEELIAQKVPKAKEIKRKKYKKHQVFKW